MRLWHKTSGANGDCPFKCDRDVKIQFSFLRCCAVRPWPRLNSDRWK